MRGVGVDPQPNPTAGLASEARVTPRAISAARGDEADPVLACVVAVDDRDVRESHLELDVLDPRYVPELSTRSWWVLDAVDEHDLARDTAQDRSERASRADGTGADDSEFDVPCRATRC